MKHVSVIIPTYNGLSLLQQNLPAVFKCLSHQDEVVIIDDGSTDQTLHWLKTQFQTQNRTYFIKGQKFYVAIGKYQDQDKEIRVVILVNKKNLRFGRSCNRGVVVAKYNLIFLLNNDVSPQSDILKWLVPYFNKNDVFAVGPLEIEPNQNQVKGGKNTLIFKRGMFIHNRAEEFSSGPTAWVSGGSGLFDRQKWFQLDGFDLDFAPAYWEDIDLSFRARQRGWKVLFESQAQVIHNHESTNQNVFGQKKIEQLSWRNAYLFVHKHATLTQKFAHYLWQPYWWWRRH